MSTNLNRRALVAGAAILPAIAIPAAAQCILAPDPVFAAIEAYRTARPPLLLAAGSRIILREGGSSLILPLMITARAKWRVVKAAVAARTALAETAPTTLAGLTAVFRFVREQSKDEFLFDGDFGAQSRGHGAALRQLWHARHRPALPTGSRRARGLRRSRADDGGTARQDCAVPAVSIYFDGIGRIDTNGPISHLVLYMRQHDEMSGTIRVKVVTLIVPTHELPIMARQLATPDIASQSSGGVADMPVSDEGLPKLMN
jgi:hypothetical protein